MFYNYFKVAIRNITRNRIFSLINIMGLSIGLAGCLIIYQYVSFEQSYNNFHEYRKHIYRISYSKEKEGIESFHTVLTYSGVGPRLKETFPEVLDFARLRPMNTITATSIVTYKDDVYEENRVYYADPSFLTICSFPILEGNALTALNDQFTAVITKSTARKYFGEEEAIGKVLRHGNDLNFTVTGVIEDVPLNSHVRFDFLLSHSTLRAVMPESWTEENINRFHGHLYVLMNPETDMALFKSKLPQFVDDYVGGRELKKSGTVLKLNVMPLEDIHLYSHIEHEPEINGDASTIQYLSLIAVLILCIAWINYINLSTARAIERANEVGVRKVLGAERPQLIKQFLFESVIINIAAIIFSIGVFAAAQPLLSRLGASHIHAVNIWADKSFWGAILALLFAGILFSGFYPAFKLSAYKPAEVLKGGNYKSGKGANLRKALVVFQFSASVALMVGTSIVYLQIKFLRNQDLGVNLSRAIVVPGPVLTDSTYGARIRSFKSELLNQSIISNVAATSDIPGREYNSATWYKKMGEPDNNAQFCYRSLIDEDYIPSLHIELIAGRNFVPEDKLSSIIINETAAKLLQYSSPQEALGTELTMLGTGSPRLSIIGVINDYHQLSPKLDYAPAILNFGPAARNYYVVKFNTSDDPSKNIQQAIDVTEKAYRASFSGNPFRYFFLDEEFEKQYKADQHFGDLFGVFAILALMVAGLGLFGLSSYTVLQRTREIGIKKVLGASVTQILRTLYRDYFMLIVIANLVSWPVIFIVMRNWLEDFAYHIPVYWWLFPIAGLFITILALLTVSFHAIQVSTANPVDALRCE